MQPEQTGNPTKLENIHLESPTEVQLRRTLMLRKDRKHLETSGKGEACRGADPAPRAAVQQAESERELPAREGLFPQKIEAQNPGWAPQPGAPEPRPTAHVTSSCERCQGCWPRWSLEPQMEAGWRESCSCCVVCF
uniref:Uncharacterized protein n=1 Tax=Myotis myotis TaxID=51298 RepID=A0A7J8ALP2_MYOMY|nr:hypothetical protein mMyoMyo1_007894 [Myotis myotis]